MVRNQLDYFGFLMILLEVFRCLPVNRGNKTDFFKIETGLDTLLAYMGW